jgi:hypothetical protein
MNSFASPRKFLEWVEANGKLQCLQQVDSDISQQYICTSYDNSKLNDGSGSFHEQEQAPLCQFTINDYNEDKIPLLLPPYASVGSQTLSSDLKDTNEAYITSQSSGRRISTSQARSESFNQGNPKKYHRSWSNPSQRHAYSAAENSDVNELYVGGKCKRSNASIRMNEVADEDLDFLLKKYKASGLPLDVRVSVADFLTRWADLPSETAQGGDDLRPYHTALRTMANSLQRSLKASAHYSDHLLCNNI